MKEITLYKSESGREFSTKKEALEEDDLYYRVKLVMDSVPEPPEDAHVRIPVDKNLARDYKRKIILICREKFPDWKELKHEPIDDIHPFSIIGGILDDFGGPLNDAWKWLRNYHDGFLYEQPYYALNSKEWEETCQKAK